MKIAIITLIDEKNNGNRLQNYALQESLKNIFPEAIIDTINLNTANTLYRKIRRFAKHILRKQPSLKNFRNFNKNISFTKKKYNELKEDYKKLIDKYDYFVTGSDQVWNLGYLQNEKYYFLDWIPTHKKLSYAASIGNNNLTDIQKAKFKNLLKTFHNISVREKESEIMLKELGIEGVETHIDPTLNISSKIWKKLAKPTTHKFKKKEYIFVCILGQMTDEYKSTIEKISLRYDLEIINLYDKHQKKIYSSGPAEFLHLIKNAKLVITDSFHCIVFSILFSTPFAHFERKDTGASSKINSRIENLEKVFNVKFLTYASIDIESSELFTPLIKDPDESLKEERNKSFEYLKKAMSPRKIHNLNECKFNCTGCGLCVNICPQKAIKIIKNDKGFYQYRINKNKCTNCGACVKLCPANNNRHSNDFSQTTILGAKNNKPLNDNSSSAGVFGKLATEILKNKGIVYGLSYNNQNEFSRITTLQDLELIKGSKYYQANISTIYPKIEKDLKANKEVLVCGTPCQIAGLKTKFKQYDNLYLISIVCHGTPSKDVLDEYCIENYGEMPNNINFRKKNPYWQNYFFQLSFKETETLEKAHDNIWFQSFIKNFFLNSCCYNCKFAGTDFGADIILGDFWGIENIDKKFYDPYGTSIVLINTPKGHEIFNKIESQIITKEYNNIQHIIKYNPCITHTNYSKEKEYAQELFNINRINKLSFEKNIKNVQKFVNETKLPIMLKIIKKIKILILKK